MSPEPLAAQIIKRQGGTTCRIIVSQVDPGYSARKLNISYINMLSEFVDGTAVAL
jgi:hypothetical protein